MRQVLCFSVVALGMSVAGLAKDDIDLETSPLLRAEYCYDHAPQSVVNELVRAGWFDCEACVDAALLIYADRVRPLVDERCPGAADVREPLLRAVTEFDHAFAGVTNGNWFGHETARHAAHVEWMIVRTWDDAQRGEPRKGYSHEDLAAVMRMWYRTNIDEEDPAPQSSPEEYTRRVNAAIAALAEAEKHCTPAQARGLRRHVMSRLAKWL
jgi:hypothetical protein